MKRHLGLLLRPRIGWSLVPGPWYLDPTASEEAQAAVRVGGVLGCISAAESYGTAVPDHPDGRVHVSVPPDLTRMRHSTDAARRVHAGGDHDVRLHREHRSEAPIGWRVSPADAIAQTAACTTVRWLTAAVDSVDEWLPVESGGIEFHSGKAVERDGRRDAVIACLGTPPLRFTQRMAVEDTAFVGDVIERTWRRDASRIREGVRRR